MRQLLFRNESKIEKYVRWNPRTEGKSYLARSCNLSEEEESVMTGVSTVPFPRRITPLSPRPAAPLPAAQDLPVRPLAAAPPAVPRLLPRPAPVSPTTLKRPRPAHCDLVAVIAF